VDSFHWGTGSPVKSSSSDSCWILCMPYPNLWAFKMMTTVESCCFGLTTVDVVSSFHSHHAPS
jgi:hypothetical protein